MVLVANGRTHGAMRILRAIELEATTGFAFLFEGPLPVRSLATHQGEGTQFRG